jgi:uncharacterized protein (DUF1501 family)
MGLRYKPFATGGKPNAPVFAVEGIVQPGIPEKKQRARQELLGEINTFEKQAAASVVVKEMREARNQAYELILGEEGKVFDIKNEDPKLRERYGKNDFGAACLIARRLVERGVPYVTINYNGWDTHKKHFEIMKQKLPELDRGFSALLHDLSDRGLLDSTLVWWGGEFGRTPKIMWDAPWNGGRGHHGACFTHLLAGGGVSGGQILGSSDKYGKEVAETPVAPIDLISLIYQQMGIPQTLPCPTRKEKKCKYALHEMMLLTL